VQRFIRRHKTSRAILALVLCFAGYVAWAKSELIHGWLAACLDIAHGHYLILNPRYIGQPPAWNSEYVRLLKERYGVEDRDLWVCIEDCGWMFDYIDGYNTISISVIKRKFGHDIFRETTGEAQRNWDLAHPERARSR